MTTESTARWRVVDGCQPAPCNPNSLAWSADNLLALACSTALHIFDASISQPRWTMHSEQLHALLANGLRCGREDVSLNGAKDLRALHSGRFFSSACWSPLLQATGRPECLMCVSTGRICEILARPSSPFQADWEPVFLLSGLLPERTRQKAGVDN